MLAQHDVIFEQIEMSFWQQYSNFVFYFNLYPKGAKSNILFDL